MVHDCVSVGVEPMTPLVKIRANMIKSENSATLWLSFGLTKCSSGVNLGTSVRYSERSAWITPMTCCMFSPESGILALYTLPAFPPLARLGRSFRYIVHRPPLFVSPPHVCDSNAFPACCSKPRGLSATMSKERLDLFWQAVRNMLAVVRIPDLNGTGFTT